MEHVLRTAGDILGENQFLVIGSQSLHAKYPDMPDHIVSAVSKEIDLW